MNSKDNTKNSYYLADTLWDFFCIASIIGIWPRFIEPNLISISKLNLSISNLPDSLNGLKILQFSDIHLHKGMPDCFIRKLINKIKSLSPDIIVCTGDFLCYSQFGDKERLKNFLCSLNAPYGCFAILGNHDYQKPVSINANGDYDIIENTSSMFSKGITRLTSNVKLSKKTSEWAKAIDVHPDLVEMLKTTPFELLHNKTKKIPYKDTFINICGLGEYTLGKCLPGIAYKDYDPHFPGIILAHNPDSMPLLVDYPGDVVLSGHTHGGQINLPWIWKKLTLLENRYFKKGLFLIKNKWLYISRGVGSLIQFRWFATPEIVLITLKGNHEH